MTCRTVRLKDAGFEVPDEILASALLKGLGSTYATFVSLVTQTYRKEAIAYDTLLAQVLDESRRIEGTEPQQALTVQTRHRCGHCRKLGYKSARCWKKHPELRRKDDSDSGEDESGYETPKRKYEYKKAGGDSALYIRDGDSDSGPTEWVF